jgi:hypothetical protein
MSITPLLHILVSHHKPEIIGYVQQQPEVFDQLVALALDEHQPQAWRAAWVLFTLVEQKSPIPVDFIEKAISKLPLLPDGHQRELLKLINLLVVPEVMEGQLFEICQTLWLNTTKSPSTRYNAFKIILRLSDKYTELKTELSFLTAPHILASLSKGVQHSVGILLKKNNRK